MNSRRSSWLWLFCLAFGSSVAAQPIITIVSPTNQSRFGKSAGMELNIRLDASVSNPPGPGTTYVNFFADGVFIGQQAAGMAGR